MNNTVVLIKALQRNIDAIYEQQRGIIEGIDLMNERICDIESYINELKHETSDGK